MSKTVKLVHYTTHFDVQPHFNPTLYLYYKTVPNFYFSPPLPYLHR